MLFGRYRFEGTFTSVAEMPPIRLSAGINAPILRRVSSLMAAYNGGEPDVDYRGLVHRAQQVAIARFDLQWVDWGVLRKSNGALFVRFLAQLERAACSD
jgi:hypothetical protein